MRNPEHVLRTQVLVARPIDEAFAFFADAGNLERITPPELNFRILTPMPVAMHVGARIDYRLGLFGIPFTWRTEITRWDPPHAFEDTQLSGPYAQWIHTHSFRADGDRTVIEDQVRYRLPVFIAGEAAWPVVRLQLARIFRHRERRIRALLEA